MVKTGKANSTNKKNIYLKSNKIQNLKASSSTTKQNERNNLKQNRNCRITNEKSIQLSLVKNTENNKHVISKNKVINNEHHKLEKKIKQKKSKRKLKLVLWTTFCIFLIICLTTLGLLLKFFIIDPQPSTDVKCNISCSIGYIADQNCQCVDINECEINLKNCSVGFNCYNTVGSFSCMDINECSKTVNVCDFGQNCFNTIGSFRCECKLGLNSSYFEGKLVCSDINECTLNSSVFGCPKNYNCSNTDGSYECCQQNSTAKFCYDCGVQYMQPELRIIGGVPTVPYSWPWQVSIGINFYYIPTADNENPQWVNVTHFCGGVLISSFNVLTAAHCLQNKKVFVQSTPVNLQVNSFHKTYESIFIIYIGVYNQDIDKLNSETIYKIESIKIHEKFDRDNLLNDIALVKLVRPVIKTIRTDVICLPNFIISSISLSAKVYAIGKNI